MDVVGIRGDVMGARCVFFECRERGGASGARSRPTERGVSALGVEARGHRPGVLVGSCQGEKSC
jgi:hypothetical protein